MNTDSVAIAENIPRTSVRIPPRIVLVAHVLVTGPVQELHRFLLDKCTELLTITHPLQPFTPVGDHCSSFEKNLNGSPGAVCSSNQWKLPAGPFWEMTHFLRHAVLTFWWGWTQGRGYDLFIGINPLNAFVGLWLKRFGCVRKVVYYTIDYIPKRFSNSWVNQFYHWIDKTCVRRCDQVWNLSSRMVGAREARGVEKRFRQKQMTVPIGTDLRIQPLPVEKVERFTFVYFGGLMEKQGVQLGIEALAILRKRLPKVRLLVIGGGSPERLEVLRQQARSLAVSEAVTFTGVIENHEEALERLSSCAAGIAPYTESPDNFTQYTDPGKPKAYLAAGLPVVLTDVPEVASLIEASKAGFIVSYDSHSLAQALEQLMTDDRLFAAYKDNARKLAERYDWALVFYNAFGHLYNGRFFHG